MPSDKKGQMTKIWKQSLLGRENTKYRTIPHPWGKGAWLVWATERSAWGLSKEENQILNKIEVLYFCVFQALDEFTLCCLQWEVARGALHQPHNLIYIFKRSMCLLLLLGHSVFFSSISSISFLIYLSYVPLANPIYLLGLSFYIYKNCNISCQ